MGKINCSIKILFTSVLLLTSLSSHVAAERLVDIDFTRDSIIWKSDFPIPSGSPNFTADVSNLTINGCEFHGTWGRFDPGAGVKAQPMYIEKPTKIRRWAFRLDNTGTSYIELPELSNIGRFTVFCKNGNKTDEGVFSIQQKKGNSWVNLRTIYIPPHHDQNLEMQMEEFLNINSVVKLRLYGATKNVHVYEIRAEAYDSAIPKEKPLKIILIPDPQAYANRTELNHIYGQMTMWINSIADDVKMVICQGDMTQLNNAAHWNIAAGAFNLLEGRKLPFIFCAGNHDMGRHADSRDTQNMNKYLPYSRYSRYDYFGGTFEPNTVDNTWHTFEWQGYKFLVISMEYAPRQKILDWANLVVEQHPNHNVIYNTHSYLDHNNTLKTGVPQDGLKGTDGEAPNNGQGIWSKLVSKHKNSLLVFSGHVTGDGTGYRVATGEKGNKIYEFMANYQGGVDGTQESRNGMNRIVDIEPNHKRFTIRTYSSYQNRYNNDNDQVYYYTGVDFIKEGQSEQPIFEPTDMLSEDFSSKAWENELARLNPGTDNNPNAPNPIPYTTPAASGSNAYTNLNSIDLYFDKYRLDGAIETLPVTSCASTEDISHKNGNAAVAFRFRNDQSGMIEFPTISSAGIITLHVRNGNATHATWLALEKFENNVWTLLKRFELLPNGALRTSIDEVLSYNIDTHEPVKLRLRNDGTRFINLYRVSVGENEITSVSKQLHQRDMKDIKLVGNKLIFGEPTYVRIYNITGNLMLNRFVEYEIELPTHIGQGVFVVSSQYGNMKMLL